MLTISTITKPWLAVARTIEVVQRLGGTPADLLQIVGVSNEALDAICAGHEAEMLRISQSVKKERAAKDEQAVGSTTKGRTVKRRPRKGKG